jgi:hypothetical protein
MSRPDPKGMGDIVAPITAGNENRGESFVRLSNGTVRHISEIQDERSNEDDRWLSQWG